MAIIRKYFYESSGRLYIVTAPSRPVADTLALRQARLSESYRSFTLTQIRSLYTQNPSVLGLQTRSRQVYVHFKDAK